MHNTVPLPTTPRVTYHNAQTPVLPTTEMRNTVPPPTTPCTFYLQPPVLIFWVLLRDCVSIHLGYPWEGPFVWACFGVAEGCRDLMKYFWNLKSRMSTVKYDAYIPYK